MNARLRAVVEALPVLVPFAAIVAGTLADLDWLRLAGTVFLALVIAFAVSRRGIEGLRRAVPGWYVAVAAMVVIGCVAALLLMDTPLALLAIPLVAGSAAALWILIALILRGLLRLNRGV